MIKGHLFPYEIEAGFFAGYKCRKCESTRRNLNVRSPRIIVKDDDIILIYPLHCACGAPGTVRLKIPILLYGYARVWRQLIHISHEPRPNKAIHHYSVDGPHCLATMLKQYEQIAERHRTKPRPELGDMDRLLMGFGTEAWAEFIRKGELEAHEEDDHQDNDPQEGETDA